MRHKQVGKHKLLNSIKILQNSHAWLQMAAETHASSWTLAQSVPAVTCLYCKILVHDATMQLSNNIKTNTQLLNNIFNVKAAKKKRKMNWQKYRIIWTK